MQEGGSKRGASPPSHACFSFFLFISSGILVYLSVCVCVSNGVIGCGDDCVPLQPSILTQMDTQQVYEILRN